MTEDERRNQERFQRLGLHWPTPDPGELHAMGMPPHLKFISVTDLNVRQPTQTVHTMPPHYPSNIVVLETTVDDETGEEMAAETREMTPEEWKEALAAYDTARKEWAETNGMRIIRSGAHVTTATFHLEHVLGRTGHAKATWTGRAWKFYEWQATP